MWTWTPTTVISSSPAGGDVAELADPRCEAAANKCEYMLVVSQKTSGKNKDIVMSKIVSFHFKKFYRI